MQLSPAKISAIYLEAAMKYNEALNGDEGEEGRQYLASRGFDIDFANQYTIGFAPYNPDRGWLFDRMIKEFKCQPVELIQAGLTTVNAEDRRVNDYFGSRRIIFPIFYQGNIISFSSRTVLKNVEPRYKTLAIDEVGLFNADIIKYCDDKVYIAEGAIDALTLELIGYHAVGIIGLSSFGKENTQGFKGYQHKVVIVTDTDINKAGQKARQKIANVLFGLGIDKVFYKQIPHTQDSKSTDVTDFVSSRGPYRAKIEFGELPEMPCQHIPEPKRQYGARTGHLELDIYDVVSRYVPEIIQEGPDRFRCICPLHMDSTPSFVLYTDTNAFKCFGCGEGGSALTFLMLKEGLEYGSAIEHAVQNFS